MTLGYSKNTVESEFLHIQLAHNKGEVAQASQGEPPEEGVINTRDFIENVKQESMDTITTLFSRQEERRGR